MISVWKDFVCKKCGGQGRDRVHGARLAEKLCMACWVERSHERLSK